jgi:indole-3-glycerol phosphate synthase
MDILQTIVEAKKVEVEQKKKLFTEEWHNNFSIELDRKCISLKDNLGKQNSTGIIAEFKRKSPSKGWFKNADYAALPVLEWYEKFGASGTSILTDEYFFGGRLEDIQLNRPKINLPILRKDFIIDEVQLHEAKASGADVILLIAAILSPQRVQELAIEAKKYGLEILLELHGEDELQHICDEVDMVGINNRNLKTFTVDIDNSLRLAKQIPSKFVKVAESGIDNLEIIKRFKDNGYLGFLIGEQFMKAEDPARAFGEFVMGLLPEGRSNS